MAYATYNDVEARTGRIFSPTEQATCTSLLDRAALMIDSYSAATEKSDAIKSLKVVLLKLDEYNQLIEKLVKEYHENIDRFPTLKNRMEFKWSQPEELAKKCIDENMEMSALLQNLDLDLEYQLNLLKD